MATHRSSKAELLEENEHLRKRVTELVTRSRARSEGRELSTELENLAEVLLSSEDIGIAICDRELRLVVWNKFMEELAGLSLDEVFGKHAHDYLPHLPEEGIDELLERALVGESVRFPDTLYHFPQTGREYWIAGNYSPMRSVDGDIIGVVANVRDITDRKQIEESLRKHTYKLSERCKELDCLYLLSSLANRVSLTLDDLCLETIELIPPSWQYPDVTCARIILEGREFSTKNYEGTGWRQTSDIIVGNKRMGTIEVCYLAEMPEADEGPFLKEERSLIDSVAEHMGRSVERIQVGQALQASKARYKDIANSIIDVFFAMDKELKYTFWNTASEKLTGVMAKDAIGKSILELFPDRENTRKAIDIYQEVLKKKKAQFFTNEYRLKGKNFFFEISVYPTIDGISVFTRDITERRQAEEELKKSESRYRHLVEYSTDGIVVLNEGGNVSEWNAAQERITGLRKNEVQDRPIWEVFHQISPPDGKSTTEEEQMKNAFQTFSGTGQAPWFYEPREHEFQRPDGMRKMVQEVAFPIITREGWMMGIIVRDLSKQRQRELALRETQERYRELVEMARVAIMIDDEEGDIMYFNERFAELHGFSVGDMKEQSIETLVHPDDAERVRTYHRQHIEGVETPHRYEFKGLKRDGSVVYLEVDVVPLEEEEVITGTRSYFWDVTSRKRAEELLRDSEERYRAIFEQAAESFVLIDAESGNIVEFNDMAYENLGYEREEFAGLKIPDFDVIESAEEVEKHIKRIIKKGSDVFLTKQKTKDGHVRDIQSSSRALTLHGRKYIQSVWRDITDQKLAEEELQQSYQQLRMLSVRIQSDREEDRSNIAREIHDELGQNLTALKMDLSWLQGELPPDRGELFDKMETILKLVDDTVQRVKRISAELRPGLLDDLGIAAAVEWQAEEFEKVSGMECRLIINPKDMVLDGDSSTAVFRVFQEILSNVARHSGASKVRVNLSVESDWVTLEVSDNGRGTRKAEVSSPTALGILGMRERVTHLGGKFDITGRGGKGTRVRVRVPYTRGKSAR